MAETAQGDVRKAPSIHEESLVKATSIDGMCGVS
jgi:mycofactocin precursor